MLQRRRGLPSGYSVEQQGDVWVIFEGETQLEGSYESKREAIAGAWLASKGQARVIGRIVDTNGDYLVDVEGNYVAALG
jgi:hypothetical protein